MSAFKPYLGVKVLSQLSQLVDARWRKTEAINGDGSSFSVGPLEILNRLFVFFSRRASLERPEIPSFAGFSVLFL